MGTPKQVQEQKNTYGFEQPPENQYMTDYRKSIENIDLTAPVVKQRAEAMDALYDPTYMPTDMNAGDYQKIMQGKRFGLNQDFGSAMQDAKLQEYASKSQGYGNVAQMMAPRMVQKSGKSEAYQTGGGLATALQIGGSVAMA